MYLRNIEVVIAAIGWRLDILPESEIRIKIMLLLAVDYRRIIIEYASSPKLFNVSLDEMFVLMYGGTW